MARYDDLNTTMIGYAAFISSLLLIVIIVGVEALSYYWENSMQEAALSKSEYTQSLDVLDAQRKSLNITGEVEVPAPAPAKGEAPKPPTKRYQIPIEKAKALTIESLGSAAVAKPGT